MHEIRMSLRRLRRGPARGFATALTLSIGVGATTSAFVAVDRVLLRDLPVELGRQRRRVAGNAKPPSRRRGPKPTIPDAALLAAIEADLEASPWQGEGTV